MKVYSKCTTINSKTAIELNLGLIDMGIISGHQDISLLGISSTCVKVRYIVFKMRLSRQNGVTYLSQGCVPRTAGDVIQMETFIQNLHKPTGSVGTLPIDT